MWDTAKPIPTLVLWTKGTFSWSIIYVEQGCSGCRHDAKSTLLESEVIPNAR